MKGYNVASSGEIAKNMSMLHVYFQHYIKCKSDS